MLKWWLLATVAIYNRHCFHGSCYEGVDSSRLIVNAVAM